MEMKNHFVTLDSFKWCLKCIAAIVLWFTILANFVISLCIVAIIKIFYRYWYSKPFNILWATDAFLQYQGHAVFGPKENTSISYFTIRFQGVADINKWRKGFEERILNIPKSDYLSRPIAAFKKRVVRKFGYYIWEEDTEFSIENHIILYPQTYDSEKSLKKILENIIGRSYLKGHSPWEILLIRKQLNRHQDHDEVAKEENEYVMAMRVHHSIADGPLLMTMCSVICDESSKQRFNEIRKLYESNPEKMSPLVKHNALVRYLARKNKGEKMTVKTIFAILANIFEAVSFFPQILIETIFHTEKNALHGVEVVGRKVLGNSEMVDLKLLKDIAAARKCTINDVVLCCIAGAFKKEDPQAKSIRSFSAFGAIRPGSYGIQNSASIAYYDIPLQPESAFLRLAQISEILNELKKSAIHLSYLLLTLLTGNHLPLFVATSPLAIPDATLGVTNLNGPAHEICFGGDVGHEVVVYAMNFLKRGAVSLSCFSYCGKVKFAAVIDRGVAPDEDIADRLMRNIVAEVEFLHASCMQSN